MDKITPETVERLNDLRMRTLTEQDNYWLRERPEVLFLLDTLLTVIERVNELVEAQDDPKRNQLSG